MFLVIDLLLRRAAITAHRSSRAALFRNSCNSGLLFELHRAQPVSLSRVSLVCCVLSFSRSLIFQPWTSPQHAQTVKGMTVLITYALSFLRGKKTGTLYSGQRNTKRTMGIKREGRSWVPNETPPNLSAGRGPVSNLVGFGLAVGGRRRSWRRGLASNSWRCSCRIRCTIDCA